MLSVTSDVIGQWGNQFILVVSKTRSGKTRPAFKTSWGATAPQLVLNAISYYHMPIYLFHTTTCLSIYFILLHVHLSISYYYMSIYFILLHVHLSISYYYMPFYLFHTTTCPSIYFILLHVHLSISFYYMSIYLFHSTTCPSIYFILLHIFPFIFSQFKIMSTVDLKYWKCNFVLQ